MKLSVLIPTLGREKEVIDTVTALGSQTVMPDEIIVVDQNQPELAGLSRFLATAPRVRHLRFETKGVSLNYNRALQAATGDLVLFLDDDVKFDSRLIEMHFKNFQNDSKLAGVAGRVEQPSGDLLPELVTQVGVYHRWNGTISACFNARHRTEVSLAPGGNMSFRRHVLLGLDGFDLGFSGNGYFFETDMSLRVRAAGHRIVFDPDATLMHLMAPAGGARVTDKAVHTYFFVKNGLRMARRHSPFMGCAFAMLRMCAYVSAKAIYNLNTRIALLGFKGIWDGLTESLQVIGLSSEQQKVSR